LDVTARTPANGDEGVGAEEWAIPYHQRIAATVVRNVSSISGALQSVDQLHHWQLSTYSRYL